MAEENDGIYKEQYPCSGFSGNACSGKHTSTGCSSVITVISNYKLKEGESPLFFIHSNQQEFILKLKPYKKKYIE